ncbi:MAG: hypothetical protein M1274_07115 [Actinobacteria bacterium]|nr:hypothetical protein [Actinomycetota bacterium]
MPPQTPLEVDGVGFDPQRLRSNDGAQTESLGLIGMQERAALLGARLDIDSSPGQGTRVVASYSCERTPG